MLHLQLVILPPGGQKVRTNNQRPVFLTPILLVTRMKRTSCLRRGISTCGPSRSNGWSCFTDVSAPSSWPSSRPRPQESHGRTRSNKSIRCQLRPKRRHSAPSRPWTPSLPCPSSPARWSTPGWSCGTRGPLWLSMCWRGWGRRSQQCLALIAAHFYSNIKLRERLPDK